MKSFKQFIKETNDIHLHEGLVSWAQNLIAKKTPQPFMSHPSVREAYDENGLLNPSNHAKIRKFVNHYTKYTQKHIDAIKGYAGWSRPLNDALHTGKPLTPKLQQQYHDMSDAVRTHKTPHDITVYSGLHWDPSKTSVEDDHHVVTQKAFTSTSLDPHTAEDFTQEHLVKSSGTDINGKRTYEGHVLHIKVPKGAHAAYIHRQHTPQAETGAFGGGYEEYHPHEIVLHPGAKLKIHKTPSQTVVKSPSGQSEKIVNIWHAQLIHDGNQDFSGKQQ